MSDYNRQRRALYMIAATVFCFVICRVFHFSIPFLTTNANRQVIGLGTCCVTATGKWWEPYLLLKKNGQRFVKGIDISIGCILGILFYSIFYL